MESKNFVSGSDDVASLNILTIKNKQRRNTDLPQWLAVFVIPLLLVTAVRGQNAMADSVMPSFGVDLPASARIVFVGNSLIEEVGKYGILEWMMVNAWPDKNLTFRNLGWSGDTADGQARSYISQPPEPYELLIQQIDTLNPALVVIGYGGVESYEGPAGLDDFRKNLDRLIMDVDSLGAQSILLSTIPQFPPQDFTVDLQQRNEDLALYAGKIQELARQHEKPFVDLFSTLETLGRNSYSEAGIHLNGQGYYTVGKTILETLGHSIPEWNITIDARNNEVVSSSGVEVVPESISRTEVGLHIRSRFNPVLVEGVSISPCTLIVRGLKKGIYSLCIGDDLIFAGPASEFAEGVEINQGPAFDLAKEIQSLYPEINELYFWEYRPMNRTYLVGFRRYEQGQNSYELAVNSMIIDRLEEKIMKMGVEKPQTLRIKRIK